VLRLVSFVRDVETINLHSCTSQNC
jgi:hypothetical protein